MEIGCTETDREKVGEAMKHLLSTATVATKDCVETYVLWNDDGSLWKLAVGKVKQ